MSALFDQAAKLTKTQDGFLGGVANSKKYAITVTTVILLSTAFEWTYLSQPWVAVAAILALAIVVSVYVLAQASVEREAVKVAQNAAAQPPGGA